MAFSLENAITLDYLTQYDARLKQYIDSGNTKAFKHVDVRDNALCFFVDPSPLADTEPSYKVDFPVEFFLDQTRTKFEQVFSWNDVDYPGTTDPMLDGMPVLVMAVKGNDGIVAYSFLDMHALVDVTVPAGGDTGDILTKKSGADYDMEWTKPAEGTVIDDDPTEDSDNAVSSGGVFTALAGKVDVVAGKQLSTEDYTTEEKEKLDGLKNYDDTALSGRVTAIEGDYLTSVDKTELQAETDAKIADRVGDIPDTTTVKEYVDNAVGSGGTDAADAIAAAKQEAIETANLYTDGKVTELTEAIGLKQDALTGTEGQFVGFDADGNPQAQEVPAVKPVEMTQAEYDLLTDEQKNDGTVRYIVDGVTMGAVPDGGTSGQVLGKLSDDDGDYGWVDQAGGTGSGAAVLAATNAATNANNAADRANASADSADAAATDATTATGTANTAAGDASAAASEANTAADNAKAQTQAAALATTTANNAATSALEAAAAAANTLDEAKAYTDEKIAALTNGAPETLDTLKEVSDALAENEDAVAALNAAIGTKAPNTNATTSAAGLMSAADKTKLDGVTASADSVAFTRSLSSGTQIGTITINGTGTAVYAPKPPTFSLSGTTLTITT